MVVIDVLPITLLIVGLCVCGVAVGDITFSVGAVMDRIRMRAHVWQTMIGN